MCFRFWAIHAKLIWKPIIKYLFLIFYCNNLNKLRKYCSCLQMICNQLQYMYYILNVTKSGGETLLPPSQLHAQIELFFNCSPVTDSFPSVICVFISLSVSYYVGCLFNKYKDFNAKVPFCIDYVYSSPSPRLVIHTMLQNLMFACMPYMYEPNRGNKTKFDSPQVY